MLNRKTLIKSYAVVATAWLAAVGAWLVLNHFRVEFYNDAMEGAREASPYWPIVRTQDILVWLILVLPPLLLLAITYETVRFVVARLRN